MSTIEKALEKLDGAPLRPPPVTAPRSPPAVAGRAPPEFVSDTAPDPSPVEIEALAVAPAAPPEPPEPVIGPLDQVVASADAAPESVTRPRIDIDFSRLARAGFITPNGDNPHTVEEYRILKRPLLRNMAQAAERGVENANIVLISSAVSGEGKTFTAINLAMSVAMELDRTVLLVDGDVPRGDVSRSLGAEVDKGLIEYLESPESPLSEFLLRTNVPKLNVLPAGRFHSHVTELLASNEMHRFAMELAARYADRVIIFDGPPLLASSVAGVLARLAGQILLVVEAIKTPEQVVSEALKLLERTDNVGLVLNKSRERRGAGYRGYYYGYGKPRESASKAG